MITYIYNNIISSINLYQIHVDISASLMIDKNIQYCRWDEDIDSGELKVIFENELSLEDKAILDTIVENNS